MAIESPTHAQLQQLLDAVDPLLMEPITQLGESISKLIADEATKLFGEPLAKQPHDEVVSASMAGLLIVPVVSHAYKSRMPVETMIKIIRRLYLDVADRDDAKDARPGTN